MSSFQLFPFCFFILFWPWLSLSPSCYGILWCVIAAGASETLQSSGQTVPAVLHTRTVFHSPPFFLPFTNFSSFPTYLSSPLSSPLLFLFDVFWHLGYSSSVPLIRAWAGMGGGGHLRWAASKNTTLTSNAVMQLIVPLFEGLQFVWSASNQFSVEYSEQSIIYHT